MSDYITCDECGERYENGPCTHNCPGSPEDRLDDIEARLSALEGERRDVSRVERELADTRAALRRLCEDLGLDDTWPDSLYLADVVEKIVARGLSAALLPGDC